jgi:hypothetical protein
MHAGMTLTSVSRLTVPVFLMLFAAQASVRAQLSSRVATVPSTECPTLILTRIGGLGNESQGGIVAAIWASGVILRAESRERPAGPHVVGELAESDLRSLLSTVRKHRVWTLHPRGLAVDYPEDRLVMQRNDERIGWTETPGVTPTRELAQVRDRLFAVPLHRAQRATGPVDEDWACQAIKWTQ